jgi:hypothetical protein
MSNKNLFDQAEAKPAPCWRIDPETGERLELVTKKNLARKDSWDDIRKATAIRQSADATL